MMRLSGRGLDCEFHFSEMDAEGWMRATVRIQTPAFEGGFVCTVQRDEWKAFVRELRRLEASIGRDVIASWENMEANIGFQFALYRLGALECSYKFSPVTISLGPTLSGKFEADQTFLSGWIREAEAVLDT
jgi:hypothetical protein